MENKQLIDKYLNYIFSVLQKSLNTRLTYQNQLYNFNEYLVNHNILLKDLDNDVIINYLKYLKDNDYRDLNLSLSAIKGLIKYLNKNYDYLINIDVKALKTPQKLPVVLNIDEVKQMISLIENSTDLLIIQILAFSGLRVSELVNLKISNINFELNYFIVLGKGSKERLVPYLKDINKQMNYYIETIRKNNNIHKYDNLLINSKGKIITRQYIYELVKQLQKKALITKEVSPHTLRHFFATYLLSKDVDIRFIQELLGHSDISTTSIYTHVVDNQLQNIYLKYHPNSHK
ncbi:MAG: tyrosine-type recombinase/integrase [Erysipelotrichaceae bacterium]